MVAVRIGYSKTTYYIIGDFWDIVAQLKAQHARFRFRARYWRWPLTLAQLEAVMQPYAVQPLSLREAQKLQLDYDRAHLQPVQEWLKAHQALVQSSLKWWELVRYRDKANPRQTKLYQAYQKQIALALAALELPPTELERDTIAAMQQVQHIVTKSEQRIVKWAAEQAKADRREELLRRFEDEMGLERENLLEVEGQGSTARQALYEELAGLDWSPLEISELKAVVRLLVRQKRGKHTQLN